MEGVGAVGSREWGQWGEVGSGGSEGGEGGVLLGEWECFIAGGISLVPSFHWVVG